jgi:Flp pilus assembly protein TadG
LNPRTILARWLRFGLPRLRGEEHAAQIVEFAVALPLMVVFVVGIFDFSGAFTLKQKLTNVARDAARSAAADPASDLTAPQNAATGPISVWDAEQIVDNYLVANHLNDCGLSTTQGSPAGLIWTYTANTGCPGGGGLILIVNRGYYFPAAASGQPPTVNCTPVAPGGQTAVISTCVSIQYPYQWRFGRAASLLGSATALPTNITATAVAMNEN